MGMALYSLHRHSKLKACQLNGAQVDILSETNYSVFGWMDFREGNEIKEEMKSKEKGGRRKTIPFPCLVFIGLRKIVDHFFHSFFLNFPFFLGFPFVPISLISFLMFLLCFHPKGAKMTYIIFKILLETQIVILKKTKL